MQSSNGKNALLALTLVLTQAIGCTLLTEAGDRQVDPDSERKFDFVFKSMSAHGDPNKAPQTLDVALTRPPFEASGKPALIGRARIVLPKAMDPKPYPDERLVMRGLLDGSQHQLYFYVDDDDDNVIRPEDPAAPGLMEHIWIRTVPADRDFKHTLTFEPFDESEYIQRGNLTLSVGGGAMPPWQVATCAAGVEQTLVVRIVLNPQTEDPLEVGYYKNYASNPPPLKDILLKGIADMSSTYAVETYVNGTLVKRSQLIAPARDFSVPFKDWYPLALPEPLLATPRCPSK